MDMYWTEQGTKQDLESRGESEMDLRSVAKVMEESKTMIILRNCFPVFNPR